MPILSTFFAYPSRPELVGETIELALRHLRDKALPLVRARAIEALVFLNRKFDNTRIFGFHS
jgi:hypothetical protein